MPRFSLTTLMLMTLCVALWMLVWAWRQPWEHVAGGYTQGPNELFPVITNHYSPDGTRNVFRNPNVSNVVVLTFQTLSYQSPQIFAVFHVPEHEMPWFDYGNENFGDFYFRYRESIVFVSDDKFVVNQPKRHESKQDAPPTQYLFHRRFPEWWWGHFYRPEVWFALALTSVLLWRTRRVESP